MYDVLNKNIYHTSCIKYLYEQKMTSQLMLTVEKYWMEQNIVILPHNWGNRQKMDWNFGEMSLFYFGSFLEILVHFSFSIGSTLWALRLTFSVPIVRSTG
jgi:hypothetical protein